MSLKIYANSTTIWSELANVTDKNGKPIFIPDPSESGVFRVLGMMVKQDDSMEDGEVLDVQSICRLSGKRKQRSHSND